LNVTALDLEPGTLIRVSVFLLVLAIMLGWERFLPRRKLSRPPARRWTSNIGISFLNVLILRLGFPFLGLGLSMFAAEQGWGLFNLLALPAWASFACALVLMDLIIYFQHRLFHAVPIFWRLHRMHHADADFDTTTGIRFHPLEAIASMIIKSAAILILGIGPLAFVVFEIVLNGTSLFNHGNVRIHQPTDRWLRWIVVTPDMHRVHHSVEERELNRNFGFNLPWWDRIFGTYQAQPEAGHVGMEIGLHDFREPEESTLNRMLTQPFRKPSSVA
jgi:sterol desaturase/sphingolipid hydroxylase (fatty acid hydroxylase superfamily)